MKHVRRTPHDDRGSTLLIAMMVMGVAVSLSVLVVHVAIGTSRTTGDDRQRLTAVNGAEAAVDAAFAKIQRSGLLLPCAWPDYGTQSMKAGPERPVSSATIVYTGASGATGCPLATGDLPVRAVITGTGTTANGEIRRMQSLVNVRAVPGEGLDKGMFGDKELKLDQSAAVSASAGERADMYSNGNFSCSNSATFQGSVVAPLGSITMTNTCAATGDVWARNAVLLEGNKTIGGRVLSATSSIAADGNTEVNGTLMARSSITWTRCTLPGKCLRNLPAVPMPPVSVFPEIRGDAAARATWRSAPPQWDFQEVAIPVGTCDEQAGDWLKARVRSLSRDTLYTTDCAVEFDNTKDTEFNRNVAIFARGGISTTNQVTIMSRDGGRYNVYFIQPYEVAARPCVRVPPHPEMGPSQQFKSTTQITLLWYSPCNISYGNLGGSFGQVYSGSTLRTNNSYALTVRQVPLPTGGISNSAVTTRAHAVDIVYKRETG